MSDSSVQTGHREESFVWWGHRDVRDFLPRFLIKIPVLDLYSGY